MISVKLKATTNRRYHPLNHYWIEHHSIHQQFHQNWSNNFRVLSMLAPCSYVVQNHDDFMIVIVLKSLRYNSGQWV